MTEGCGAPGWGLEAGNGGDQVEAAAGEGSQLADWLVWEGQRWARLRLGW